MGVSLPCKITHRIIPVRKSLEENTVEFQSWPFLMPHDFVPKMNSKNLCRFEINKAFPIWIIGLIWFDNNVDACIFGYFWGMNQVYPAISNQQPRFEMRHADADIIALMENTVPPADINKIAIFAAPLAKYHAEVGCGHQTELSVVYFEWTTAIINWWTYITSYHIGWL